MIRLGGQLMDYIWQGINIIILIGIIILGVRIAQLTIKSLKIYINKNTK